MLNQTGFHPMAIFVQAFDFYEVRAGADVLNETFNKCCVPDGENRSLVRIPVGVNNYVIEFLEGRATPIGYERKQPGGGSEDIKMP